MGIRHVGVGEAVVRGWPSFFPQPWWTVCHREARDTLSEGEAVCSAGTVRIAVFEYKYVEWGTAAFVGASTWELDRYAQRCLAASGGRADLWFSCGCRRMFTLPGREASDAAREELRRRLEWRVEPTLAVPGEEVARVAAGSGSWQRAMLRLVPAIHPESGVKTMGWGISGGRWPMGRAMRVVRDVLVAHGATKIDLTARDRGRPVNVA